MNRRALIAFATAVVTLLTGAVVATTLAGDSDEPSPPVERSDAISLLNEAARLARARDFDGLCRSVAATVGTCEFLLQSAADSEWEPGPGTPTVTTTTRTEKSLTLHLRGQRLDGSAYTSDFEVMWVEAPGDGRALRSRTPIYWGGVTITAPTTCETSPGQVRCRDRP